MDHLIRHVQYQAVVAGCLVARDLLFDPGKDPWVIRIGPVHRVDTILGQFTAVQRSVLVQKMFVVSICSALVRDAEMIDVSQLVEPATAATPATRSHERSGIDPEALQDRFVRHGKIVNLRQHGGLMHEAKMGL